MAVRSVILFIGVYFGFGKAADTQYAKLGGTITLVPTFTGQMDEILWKHNGDKVVEFDGRQDKEFRSFVGRTVLDFVTGELTISALTAEDSGLYQLVADIDNLLKFSNHEVQVIAEVAQPTIICEVNDTKTASMATLQCNADRQDQQSPIKYNWECLEDTLHGSVSTDQKLSIAVKDRHDEAVFQCSVSNLVSKKQAQFKVKNCFTEESSSTALAVGLSMLFLIILLIVLGLLLYCMIHRKAKPNSNKQDDVEVPLVQGRQEAEEGMEAGDVGEKKTDGGGDTYLGMDGSMETEDAENKKSAEDVGNMEQPSIKKEKEGTDESEEEDPGSMSEDLVSLRRQAQMIRREKPKRKKRKHLPILEKANVSSPVVAVGMDVKNANIQQDVKKDKGGVKVGSQMEEAGSDEHGETGHQKQPDTDKTGQNDLLESPSNPTQHESEPEAIKIMLETNTVLKCETPVEGHRVENSESFSASPGGEDVLNDTENGMDTRDGKTEQKTNDGGIVENARDQNGEEAIVKAEQEKDLSVSETLNSEEDQITANTPDAVAVSMPAELSQVQPEPNDSKAGRDMALCQQEGMGMEAGDVGEKKTEGEGDTSLGMDGSMETEDAENKKSAEDVGNMEQLSMKEEKVDTDESVEKEIGPFENWKKRDEECREKDRGGMKVGSQMEEAGSDEQGETGHQKQPDTDKMGQTRLLKNQSNPTQHESEPEAINNMLETNTESKSEAPAEGHQAENSESFSTFPGGEEGDENGLNDTEKGMETRDGKTEQKTNDGEIVENARDQNGEEAIVEAEQEKDLSDSETLNSEEDQITANTPDAVAVSKPAELSQVQPEPNDSKAGRDMALCQQEGMGMEAGDVGEKKTEGEGDTSLGMDGSMETEDAENKKSAEDVGNMEQLSMKEEKVDTDESVEKEIGPFENWKKRDEECREKDRGGMKVGSQMEEAGSDEQGETGHQKQPDTDKMGQTRLLKNQSNPTQHESEPEAINNMLETNTESKSEAPAEGHQAENSESFSTFPGGEEGDENRLNDTEKGMETWDGKTEQKTNDGGIVEDVMDQNGEEAFVKAPDAVAVSKPAELSQVQPEPNDSKAERDMDPCQQPKSSSSSSTSPGELVGSDGSKEAEDGMKAGDVGEKKTEGEGDTSLGMDGSMETEDAENKKSAEDVGNMEQLSMKEEKVDTDESVEKEIGPIENWKKRDEECREKDRGGMKVGSQMEEAGSDEQGETGHQKQPDTDKIGQTRLLKNQSNPTQHESEPEAINNMLETNTESKSEAPAEGHQAENSESFSTFPGGEEGDENGLNDTEKGMETWDGKTEQKTNDGGIVEDVMDQNGEEAFVKAPDAVAVSKPAELSQVQPEPNDSKAERDVDPCQQPKSSSSSSTSPGELVGSDGSKEAEDGMKAGDVGEKKTEGGGDTSLGMDRSMEAEDAENKKSTEDVGNMEQLSSKEEKVGTDESAEKDPYISFIVWLEEDEENYVIKDEDYIKVNSQMEEAGSDEQGDKTEEKDKGTEQGETNSKLEHWKDTDELQGKKH